MRLGHSVTAVYPSLCAYDVYDWWGMCHFGVVLPHFHNVWILMCSWLIYLLDSCDELFCYLCSWLGHVPWAGGSSVQLCPVKHLSVLAHCLISVDTFYLQVFISTKRAARNMSYQGFTASNGLVDVVAHITGEVSSPVIPLWYEGCHLLCHRVTRSWWDWLSPPPWPATTGSTPCLCSLLKRIKGQELSPRCRLTPQTITLPWWTWRTSGLFERNTESRMKWWANMTGEIIRTCEPMVTRIAVSDTRYCRSSLYRSSIYRSSATWQPLPCASSWRSRVKTTRKNWQRQRRRSTWKAFTMG